MELRLSNEVFNTISPVVSNQNENSNTKNNWKENSQNFFIQKFSNILIAFCQNPHTKPSGVHILVSFATWFSFKPTKMVQVWRDKQNDMNDSKLHCNQLEYQPQPKVLRSKSPYTHVSLSRITLYIELFTMWLCACVCRTQWKSCAFFAQTRFALIHKDEFNRCACKTCVSFLRHSLGVWKTALNRLRLLVNKRNRTINGNNQTRRMKQKESNFKSHTNTFQAHFYQSFKPKPLLISNRLFIEQWWRQLVIHISIIPFAFEHSGMTSDSNKWRSISFTKENLPQNRSKLENYTIKVENLPITCTSMVNC